MLLRSYALRRRIIRPSYNLHNQHLPHYLQNQHCHILFGENPFFYQLFQADKIWISSKSGEGLVWRISIAGRPQRQDLPVTLAGSFSASTNSYAFLSKHPIPYFEGRLLIGSSTPHFLFFAIFFPPSISLVNTENQAVFHARQSYFVRYTYFDIKRWESSMFRIDCLC